MIGSGAFQRGFLLTAADKRRARELVFNLTSKDMAWKMMSLYKAQFLQDKKSSFKNSVNVPT